MATNNYAQAIAYAHKCIDSFKQQARRPAEGPSPRRSTSTNKDQTFAQWALNDVGTCYYILGPVAYEKRRTKPRTQPRPATSLVEDLPFSQCYDPKGWFWKPAEAAKEARQKPSSLTYDEVTRKFKKECPLASGLSFCPSIFFL